MSSHHVVRDQQEPALIIADVNHKTYASIAPLLEWSPTIIVLDTCLEKVLKWGVKIDEVITDDNNVALHHNKLKQPINVLSTTNERTPIDVALDYLVKNGYEAVNVIGEFHKLLPSLEQYITHIQIVVHNATSRSYYIKEQFRKWVNLGVKFNIFPEKAVIKTNGLQPKNNELVAEEDGIIFISCDSPFWLKEYL